MTEQERQRIIRQKLVRLEKTPVPFGALHIPTGLAALDAALGGGFPRGHIVEIFGAESTGKTTLALQTAAHAIEAGAAAAWIDAEHVFDPTQAAGLGIALERLLLAQPDSAEQALEMGRRLLESRALDLLVIDSAAALVPVVELETGLGEGSHSLHSRVLASGLRRVSAAASRSGAVVLALNQTRAGAEGAGETSAGGPPLKLFAVVRIALESTRAGEVRFRILKNKAGRAFAAGKLRWEDGCKFVTSP